MCDCKICKRDEKFDEMIELVQDENAKDFFSTIYADFLQAEDYLRHYKSEYDLTINYITKEYPQIKEQLRLMRKKEDFYDVYASRINMG